LKKCKKQIEISLDYFNSSAKHNNRNKLKSSSAKYQSTNGRSRNSKKNGFFTKSTGKCTNPVNKVSNLTEKRISTAYTTNTHTAK